jgi:WD40 repeat protein
LASSGGPCDFNVVLKDREGKLVKRLDVGARLACLAWSPDGFLMATGNGDGSAQLWTREGKLVETLANEVGPPEWEGGPEPEEFVPTAHEDGQRVSSCAWSPNGSMLASGSIDGTVRLWDREKQWLNTIEHMEQVNCCAWSPDGSLLASGTNFGTIRLWDREGELVKTLKGHGKPVKCCAWRSAAHSFFLVSGWDDKSVMLWNTELAGWESACKRWRGTEMR